MVLPTIAVLQRRIFRLSPSNANSSMSSSILCRFASPDTVPLHMIKMMLQYVSGMWDSQSTARPGHRAGLEHTTGTLAEGRLGCCFCAITAMCTKDCASKSCRLVRVCCTCKLFRLRSGGIPPSTPSPPVFAMEQQSRGSPAPSRSGDAPNFCLIKLDLPGPAPGPFSLARSPC